MRALPLVLAVAVLAPVVVAADLADPCASPVATAVLAARGAPASASLDAASWRTWSVHVGDVHVPPPPGARSAEAAREREELAESAEARTPERIAAAARWSEGPASAPWERLALDLLAGQTLLDPALDPPRIARHLGILETTLHDALILAWDAKECYRRAAPTGAGGAPAYPDERAVVAGVAWVLLPAMFPHADAPGLKLLAREAAESPLVLGQATRSDVEAGLSLGREVARLALERRAADGSAEAHLASDPPVGGCLWSSTPPGHKPALLPGWGRVRPFALYAASAARPPPPPPCGSDAYRALVEEVHRVSRTLAPEEEAIARRWAGGPGTDTPPGMALRLALNASLASGSGTMAHARVMSAVGAAIADAGIAAWDAKYAYWSERPLHAIRAAHDPTWTPLLPTPPFPGYVSGHATFSGAAATVLAASFPEEAETFWRDAEEAAHSRLLGGIHVRADNDAGLVLGRAVGEAALARIR